MDTQVKRTGTLAKKADGLSKELMSCGVPGRYWKVRKKDVAPPTTIMYERPWYKEGKPYQVTPAQQQELIDDIFDGDYLGSTSELIVVGSEPTEDLGLVFGVSVVEKAIRRRMRVRMFPVHRTPRESSEKIPDVCILYNIAGNASQFRLDICREWITELDDVLVFLLVAGTDPVSFCFDTLKQSFDHVLYFKGQYHGEVGQRRV